MKLPTSLKGALAIAGIAIGLSGCNSTEQKKASTALVPDVKIDVSNYPKGNRSKSSEGHTADTIILAGKDVTDQMYDAAAQVCREHRLGLKDIVNVQIVDDSFHDVTIRSTCGDTWDNKNHRQR